jgi:hypothetical protein
MSNNTISHLSKKIEDGPATFQVAWEYDNSPDSSFIGEWTDRAAPWTVDRENGWLLGEYTPETELVFFNKEDMNRCADKLEVKGYEVSTFTTNYDDKQTEFTVFFLGHEVLARNLRKTYERHAYRYFVPPNSYEDVTQEERVKYILQDYERADDYSKNLWDYTGCIVTMFVDGLEVAAASLWGIESDSGDDYIHEVEQDLIAECKSEAKTKAAALRDAANKLDEYLG